MPTPTLKRHNHRVHPCEIEKKEELLKLLLSQNTGKKIIVVTSEKSELTTEQDNVSIVSDKELYKNPELRCELLISFDLPQKAIVYMSRITKSDSHAIVLMDPSEEKLLHPIETLNGRTIMQELIEGFSEERIEKQAQPSKLGADTREERKKVFVTRDDEKPKREFKDKKPYEDRPKKDFKDKKPYDDKPRKSYSDNSSYEKKPWDKKKREENKFLGKDENGKAIFSGKSGERNHRHDGTPKFNAPKLTGKKISIKGKTKKEDK